MHSQNMVVIWNTWKMVPPSVVELDRAKAKSTAETTS